MAKIKTSKEQEIVVNWCGVSRIGGDVLLERKDQRAVHEIAEEIEGVEWIERDLDGKVYDGPFTVILVSKEETGVVQIALRKKVEK